jgi:hypothetical protein
MLTYVAEAGWLPNTLNVVHLDNRCVSAPLAAIGCN